jgi:hypothetical protein
MDVESLPHYCRIFPPAWPKSFYYIVLFLKLHENLSISVCPEPNKQVHALNVQGHYTP